MNEGNSFHKELPSYYSYLEINYLVLLFLNSSDTRKNFSFDCFEQCATTC